jgi:thioredoxin-related protein
MKRVYRLLLVTQLSICCAIYSFGQASKPKIYDPEANAKEVLDKAVERAAKEQKHVFIQVGGNWCVWCHRFNETVMSSDTLRGLLDHSYVTMHLNYSPENKNEALLAALDYPQRFGFPVFVILDSKGKRIHTQNSAYLEEGKGHSKDKIFKFLYNWTPTAIDPSTYK